MTSGPEGQIKSIDTGKAALLAYTNLDQPNVEDLVGSNEWRKGANTRNVAMVVSSGGGEAQNNRDVPNLKAQTAASESMSQHTHLGQLTAGSSRRSENLTSNNNKRSMR